MRILCALLFCLPLFAAESYRDLRLQARKAYQAQNYTLFYFISEKAHKQRPDDVNGILNLAVACALTKRSPQAVKLLEKLAALGLAYDTTKLPLHKPLEKHSGYIRVTKKLAANRKPISRAQKVFTLPQNDFYPEGIAHDPKTGHFFIGSVYHRRIDRFDAKGKSAPFITPARDGIWSVMGLAVDSKRNELLVCSAAMDQTGNLKPEEKGRSAVFRYNLADGKLKSRILLAEKDKEHALGDLVLAKDGTAYISDARGGGIYTLAPDADQLTLLISSSDLASPQGMAFSKDETMLYIADWTYGLFAYAMKSKKLKRVTPARPAVLNGIDGLVRHGDYLVGIQNGIQPNRVARWKLTLDGTHVITEEVLESANPVFDEPTLGTLVGDKLYFVATSHWPRYKDNKPLPAEELEPIHILSLDLKAP
ncbi:MAG: SMP-30/gluconolactonase/LRE family protein [Acidobacteriota bacterium]|nr:SMP-30/gluconolactonase/LRE family protein [Acidobacteriota bacterium]